jgi:hypothetical protein
MNRAVQLSFAESVVKGSFDGSNSQRAKNSVAIFGPAQE